MFRYGLERVPYPRVTLTGTVADYLPEYRRPELARLRGDRAVETASRALIPALENSYDVTVTRESDPEFPDADIVSLAPNAPGTAVLVINYDPESVFVKAGVRCYVDYMDPGVEEDFGHGLAPEDDDRPTYGERCVEDFEAFVAGVVGGGLTEWATRKMFTWWEFGELSMPEGNARAYSSRSLFDRAQLEQEFGWDLRCEWEAWPRKR